MIGIFANLLNAGSLIPSVQHVYETKDLKSYPVLFLAMMIFSNSLWVWYGMGKGAEQTAIMGIIFTIYYAMLLFWKLKWEGVKFGW